MPSLGNPRGITPAFHLREDHIAFDRRFDDLCRSARDGDWRDLDELWDRFVRDVQAHFEFEETEVFPEYAKQGRDAATLVDALTAEHREMESVMADLGVEIQLHNIRADTIDAFVERMRHHAAVENNDIYPWAERRLGFIASANALDRSRRSPTFLSRRR